MCFKGFAPFFNVSVLGFRKFRVRASGLGLNAVKIVTTTSHYDFSWGLVF